MDKDQQALTDLAILGDRRDSAQREAREAMAAIRRLARRAHRSGIAKTRIAQAAKISRPTLDELLK